ncbi:hypothetical protein ACOSP7_026749 [Xanthoceras sorbifolium]
MPPCFIIHTINNLHFLYLFNLFKHYLIIVKSSRTIDSFFKRKDVYEDDALPCHPLSNLKPSMDKQQDAIAHMITINELETGKWANQLGNLQRAGDTRWGSHFHSTYSLLRIFGPTCVVLQNIINDGSNYTQRGDADAAYDAMTSFEFVFILHLMKEIMGFTDILCQALQQKSQDISNAMRLVSTTKALIQNMREDGWEFLLENVNSFRGMKLMCLI